MKRKIWLGGSFDGIESHGLVAIIDNSDDVGDGFGSSHTKFEERSNPFLAAGTKSTQAIIDHALEDLIKSKKAAKTLMHLEGSRKTEDLVALGE